MNADLPTKMLASCSGVSVASVVKLLRGEELSAAGDAVGLYIDVLGLSRRWVDGEGGEGSRVS